jgi:hypothetical protein
MIAGERLGHRLEEWYVQEGRLRQDLGVQIGNVKFRIADTSLVLERVGGGPRSRELLRYGPGAPTVSACVLGSSGFSG